MLPIMHRNSWLPEVFNDFINTDFAPRVNTTSPAINVIENEKEYTVELAAPGLKKEDFNVNIDNEGNLSIKMERKEEKKEEDKKPKKSAEEKQMILWRRIYKALIVTLVLIGSALTVYCGWQLINLI